jgi:DNA-binding HxlR family transcriptional regulator
MSPSDLSHGLGRTLADTLGPLASKWALKTLLHLADGPLRYNALRRRMPAVSQKVLTETLRTLERNGYVERHSAGTAAPQVEYRLAALGLDLLPALEVLVAKAAEHLPRVLAAQQAYDARVRGQAQKSAFLPLSPEASK